MESKPNSFQFHLTTALFVMVALGALTPVLLRSFRVSVTEGAAMTYAFALPIVMGAFEIESFLLRRSDPNAKYERPRQAGSRVMGSLLYFVVELAMIGLWAICVAKVIPF